jgi:hypothetical protein
VIIRAGRVVCVSLAFVLAAGGLAACGDDGHDHDHDIDAAMGNGDGGGDPDATVAPRETVTRTISLGAGSSAEGEVALVQPGDKVRVRATADAATLAWNVHTHQNGATQILDEASGVDAIDFVIEGAAGDYYLLLVNASGTLGVTVDLDLYGGAQYTGGL